MFFLQASKAPVAVTINEKVFLVPKLRMKDLTEWGAKIKADKIEELTAGMDKDRRQEYLSFYDIPMPDINAFRKMTVTVDGSQYILQTQLAKARTADGEALTVQEIEALLEEIPFGTKASLAWEVADMEDTSQRNIKAKKEKEETTNP